MILFNQHSYSEWLNQVGLQEMVLAKDKKQDERQKSHTSSLKNFFDNFCCDPYIGNDQLHGH